jgi:hypothetical protein
LVSHLGLPVGPHLRRLAATVGRKTRGSYDALARFDLPPGSARQQLSHAIAIDPSRRVPRNSMNGRRHNLGALARGGLSRLSQPLSPLPNPCMPRARCVVRVAHHSRNRPLGASTGRVPRLHR